MCETGEGKIIRLELSRQKNWGKGKATPLLETPCETQNLQLKIMVLCLGKTETQQPEGWEGIRSPFTHGPLASKAHTLGYRTKCLHSPCPALQDAPHHAS